MEKFKFLHYLEIGNAIYILAKDKKQAYDILYNKYSNASDYYLDKYEFYSVA
jgi:hypothetical protein